MACPGPAEVRQQRPRSVAGARICGGVGDRWRDPKARVSGGSGGGGVAGSSGRGSVGVGVHGPDFARGGAGKEARGRGRRFQLGGWRPAREFQVSSVLEPAHKKCSPRCRNMLRAQKNYSALRFNATDGALMLEMLLMCKPKHQ